jgi:hypothetical protein
MVSRIIRADPFFARHAWFYVFSRVRTPLHRSRPGPTKWWFFLFSLVKTALDWTRLTCVGVFIHDTHDEILAAFTVLLAFFTLALWASTSELARDARESAQKTIKTMEDTARKELRAYVSVQEVDMTIVSSLTLVWWTIGE